MFKVESLFFEFSIFFCGMHCKNKNFFVILHRFRENFSQKSIFLHKNHIILHINKL